MPLPNNEPHSSIASFPTHVALDWPVILVGRAEEADLRLVHPAVSRRHAEIHCRGMEFLLHDSGSPSGVRVNGKRVHSQSLIEGDVVSFGPLEYYIRGNWLVRRGFSAGIRLDVSGLSFAFHGQPILTDATFNIRANSFVGIIGPSGSGKTTLLKGLTGYLPAAHGEVLFDGKSLRDHQELCMSWAGFVPQDDLLYKSLTARENLNYTLRLRVAGAGRRSERESLVASVLEQMGLSDEADRPVATLSGGQRKRVNVGLELLHGPRLLLLDEPTAGLDPFSEKRMMVLLSDLSKQGATVLCTTHVLESLDLFNRIIVVANGRIVANVKPENLLRKFQATTYAELYRRIESIPASNLPVTFTPVAKKIDNEETPPPARVGFMRQFAVQVRRDLALLVRDRVLFLFLGAQPLLIAGLILVSQSQARMQANLNIFFTFAVVACIWLGLNNTAREIVRNRNLYARDRRASANPYAFVLAKPFVFGVLGFVQVCMLTGVLYPGIRWMIGNSSTLMSCFQHAPWWQWILVFWATYLAAMFLGLVVSTLASSEEVAVAVLPLIVLPQLLLTATATNLAEQRDGWFQSLDVAISQGTFENRGVGGCVLEGLSLLTYSRPALVFLLTFDRVDRPLAPPWGVWLDVAHLIFMLFSAFALYVLFFFAKERQWVRNI